MADDAQADDGAKAVDAQENQLAAGLDAVRSHLGELKDRVSVRADALREQLAEGRDRVARAPSELRSQRMMEAVMEDVAVGVGTGVLIGGVVSLVVLRSRRGMLMSFGGGWGGGLAYANGAARYNELRKPQEQQE